MEFIQLSSQEYEQLEEENKVHKEIVASLTAKITELEARINKNSKNSSKPPSSDGPKKGTVKNNRAPSDRKSGGQPGHTGATKLFSPAPDVTVELVAKTECECGGQIILETDTYTVRQVTDIQPAKIVTVEYRTQEGVCSECGKIHKASFPEGVTGPVSYGDNLQAIVTNLTTYQLIPLKRTTELVEDLFGVKLSQGMIVASGQEAYDQLTDTEMLIRTELKNSEVVHFDETGMRVKSKTQWLHSAGTESCILYSIHEKRGTAGLCIRFIATVLSYQRTKH